MLRHIINVSLLFLFTANIALSQSVQEQAQIEKDADLLYQLKKFDEEHRKKFNTENVNAIGKIDFSGSDDFLRVLPTETWDSAENPKPELNFPIFNNGLPAGDINGDGRNDIVVTSNARDDRTPQLEDEVTKTAVFFSGSMSDTPDQLFYKRLIPVGDLNNDGYSDAIAEIEGVGYELYQGSSEGYQPTGILVEVPDPNSVSYNFHGFADFEGDGYGDVVISTFNDPNSIYVLWGGENESEAELQYYEIDHPYSISNVATGNISNNNYDELIVTGYSWGDTFSISHFTFTDRNVEKKQIVDIELQSISPRQNPMLLDLNGDGRKEIVLAWFNSSDGSDSIEAYSYSEASNSIEADPIELYSEVIYPIGDVNNNGRVDFITRTEDGNPGIMFTPQNLADGLSVNLILDHLVEDGFNWSVPFNIYGDLDGDGVDDFIISLISDSEIIRGYVRGSESEILETEYVHFQRDSFYNRTSGITNVGDINGDGSDDLVLLEFDKKRLKVFFNTEDLHSPSHFIDLEFNPVTVSGGDVNGSGINDLVIGYSAGNRVDLVFGGENLSSTPDHKIDPEDFMSATLSRIYRPKVLGDINNSGYDDIGFSSLFSYDGDQQNREYVGEVYIILGNENISNTPDITLSKGVDFNTPSNNYIGWSLTGLGDVSGNGIADFAFTNLFDDSGKVLVYYGNENAQFTSPDVILEPEQGEDNTFRFGVNIAAADFTGNGFNDLAVLSGFAYERLLRIYEGGDGIGQQADHFTGVHVSTGMGDSNINSSYPELINYVPPGRGNLQPVRDVNLPERFGLVLSTLTFQSTNAAYYSSFDLIEKSDHKPTFLFESPNQSIEMGTVYNFTVGNFNGNNKLSVIFDQTLDNNSVFRSSRLAKYNLPMALELASVDDVPDDQGYWVTVHADGWYFDGQDHGHQEFASWSVWLEGDDGWESRSTVNYLEGAAKKVDIRLPTTLPTIEEPTESSPHTYNLKLTAYDGNGALIAESNQQFGYALDNIAPEKVTGLSGEVLEENFVLSWNPSRAHDLANYLIWELDDNGVKSDVPVFETLETEIELDLSELVENHDIAVSAIDIHGNEGEVSNTLNVGVLTSSDDRSGLPNEFDLTQNYPNPFNPTTTIRYALPQASDVQLEVFNMLGQRVALLADEHKSAGWHTATFDASNLSSGMYIYRLQAGEFVQTRKLTLIK